MKERPILFSAPMVRAIRSGSKTQTRRVVKLPTGQWNHDATLQELDTKSRPLGHPAFGFESTDGRFIALPCPYGGVSDRLWVRETWKPCWDDKSGTEYKADERGGCGPWKPSIFMPRNRSRLTLAITVVRVEWVQDISEEDAKAEGCETVGHWIEGIGGEYRNGYAHLWDSINGKKYPWSSNPWVWVVEFQLLPVQSL